MVVACLSHLHPIFSSENPDPASHISPRLLLWEAKSSLSKVWNHRTFFNGELLSTSALNRIADECWPWDLSKVHGKGGAKGEKAKNRSYSLPLSSKRNKRESTGRLIHQRRSSFVKDRFSVKQDAVVHIYSPIYQEGRGRQLSWALKSGASPSKVSRQRSSHFKTTTMTKTNKNAEIKESFLNCVPSRLDKLFVINEMQAWICLHSITS